MKILWIVNSLLNEISAKLYGKPANGLWMDALLSDFRGKDGLEIAVATTAKRKDRFEYRSDNISYFVLPDEPPILYNENKKSNIAAWRKLIEDVKPDIIQVWGTEFKHGLCALREAGNIPSIIYMQGYLRAIAKYYTAGISYDELKKTRTFRDFVKRDGILAKQRKYYASAEKEAEMFRLAGRIISENQWCNINVRAAHPDIEIFNCPLNINPVFSKYEWKADAVEPHSIICTAPGYTIKGLHMLLRAVALLKKKYPDVKLYIPGDKEPYEGLIGALRKDGYSLYIEKLTKELGLDENIVWLGRLPQEGLAAEYAKRRVFVMPSSIENHSSSLKEAMMVGTPSVSSYVGGIPEYLAHGESGFIYRFEEYEMLADYVSRLFDDDELAKRFSDAGRERMLRLHGKSATSDVILRIYREIAEETK